MLPVRGNPGTITMFIFGAEADSCIPFLAEWDMIAAPPDAVLINHKVHLHWSGQQGINPLILVKPDIPGKLLVG